MRILRDLVGVGIEPPYAVFVSLIDVKARESTSCAMRKTPDVRSSQPPVRPGSVSLR